MCCHCYSPEPIRRTLTHQPEPRQQHLHHLKSTPAYLMPTKYVPDRLLPYQKLYVRICQIHIPNRFKTVKPPFSILNYPDRFFYTVLYISKTSNFIKITIYTKILILHFLTILAIAVKNHILGKNIYLKKRAFLKKNNYYLKITKFTILTFLTKIIKMTKITK